MRNVVLDTICSQHSGRIYRTEQFPDSLLREILAAGCSAPGGMGGGANHFMVVQSAKELQQLRHLVQRELAALESNRYLHRMVRFSISQAQQEHYDFTYGVPTLILIANSKESPDAVAEAALAAGNMMLAAHALKLGSCYLSQLSWLDDNPAVRQHLEQLGLGTDERVCSCVGFGYLMQERPGVPAPESKITLI